MNWNYRFISRLPENFDDDDILFIRQLGIDYTYYSLPIADHNYESLKRIVERIASKGLKFEYIQSNLFTFNSSIVLGTGDHKGTMEKLKEFIEIASSLGINGLELDFQPFFIYSSGIETTNRCAVTRTTDLDVMLNSKIPPLGKPAWVNPDHDSRRAELEKAYYAAKERGYTKEELWDNFAYLFDSVGPTCERCNFKISLHPADPPCEESIGGVPQLIHSFEDYKKAFSIAGDKAMAMTFCCGCWLEGGKKFGDLLENLEEALRNNWVDVLHVRNISGPLPHFDETFIDNGYFDYYPVFKLLAKYNYQGYINPDHHPIMVDGPRRRAPQSYAFGFMRAYAMRAAAEENV
jgi:mannonate dehydratase